MGIYYITLRVPKQIRTRGPMARRLTFVSPGRGLIPTANVCHSTNQEIHGSIPCTFIFFFLISLEQETGETRCGLYYPSIGI